MIDNQLRDKLKKIQINLQTIFNLLEIPYTKKIDSIYPISEELIELNKNIILKNLTDILEGLQEIKSEKLVQITDFKDFLEKIIPIINEIKLNIKKSQINAYKNLYLIIQIYWFIEYFIKHELELKNNEFFNEGCHYKWIIDDKCLDFLIILKNNPNSSIDVLSELDDKRRGTIINIKLIKIRDEMVDLTSLGEIICDLAEIGDTYSYYIDEFNEIFEEPEE